MLEVDITSSPQGDGNECDLERPALFEQVGWHYIFPARGWKPFTSTISWTILNSWHYIFPARGWKQVSPKFCACAWTKLTLHLPRKGMETENFCLSPASLQSWHYIFPARGWKPKVRYILTSTLVQVDITSSPQGDGNYVFANSL